MYMEFVHSLSYRRNSAGVRSAAPVPGCSAPWVVVGEGAGVPAPASGRAPARGVTRDFKVASRANAPRWPIPKTGVTVLHRTR